MAEVRAYTPVEAQKFESTPNGDTEYVSPYVQEVPPEHVPTFWEVLLNPDEPYHNPIIQEQIDRRNHGWETDGSWYNFVDNPVSRVINGLIDWHRLHSLEPQYDSIMQAQLVEKQGLSREAASIQAHDLYESRREERESRISELRAKLAP